jgi:20S proteasome subunit beta 5
MDTLVAQYSRPMFEKENYSEEEQMDLYQGAPSLSLRFAMPPIAQVGAFSSSFITFEALRTFRKTT